MAIDPNMCRLEISKGYDLVLQRAVQAMVDLIPLDQFLNSLTDEELFVFTVGRTVKMFEKTATFSYQSCIRTGLQVVNNREKVMQKVFGN